MRGESKETYKKSLLNISKTDNCPSVSQKSWEPSTLLHITENIHKRFQIKMNQFVELNRLSFIVSSVTLQNGVLGQFS